MKTHPFLKRRLPLAFCLAAGAVSLHFLSERAIAQKPAPAPASAEAEKPSPQVPAGDPLSTPGAANAKALATLDGFEKETTQRVNLLVEGATKMESREFGWSLQSYGNQWSKLSGDCLALYRLEQFAAATPALMQKQKDILAAHYFYVAQGTLGLKPNLRLFSKRDPQSDDLWNEMRGELDAIESFCRTRCAELSPEASKVMVEGAAKLTRLLKDADK